MKELIFVSVVPCMMLSAFCMTESEFASLKAKAEGGDAESMCEVGRCYRNGIAVGKDIGLASEWTQKAVAAGLERAKGCCCEFGYGTQTNLVDAVEWYRKAAENGDAKAMLDLGICYDYGSGVKKDPKLAVDWYRRASEKGDARAMYNLGCSYADGEGVEKDAKQAVEWYRKAADKGDVRAMKKMGSCYQKGNGVDKNQATAVEWYRKAADNGDAYSMWQLGFCYKKGDGVPKDIKLAVEWYRKAAEHGNAVSMLQLGNFYMGGQGVDRDPKQAVEWYRKAAEKGEDFAMLRLGDCYKDGEGVEKDLHKALDWYRKVSSDKQKDLAQKKIQILEPIIKASEKEAVEAAEAADIAEKAKSTAKKFVGETLVLKSFYAGMPKEDAEALCKSYLGLKRGEEISKACGYENGNLKELILSRADIDTMFSVSGISCEMFAKKLLEAYPIIGKFEVETEEVPDVERQAKVKKGIDAKWMGKAMAMGGDFETGRQMGIRAASEYDSVKDSITKSAKVYRCESKKGFLLEIHEGNPDRFLILKKTSVINMSNFD